MLALNGLFLRFINNCCAFAGSCYDETFSDALCVVANEFITPNTLSRIIENQEKTKLARTVMMKGGIKIPLYHWINYKK